MPRRLPVGGRHVRCEQTKTCVPVVKQALGQALLLLLPLPHQRLTLHTVPRGHGCGRDGKRQQRFEHGVAVGRSPCHGVCGAMRMRPNTDTVARHAVGACLAAKCKLCHCRVWPDGANVTKVPLLLLTCTPTGQLACCHGGVVSSCVIAQPQGHA